MRNYLWFVFLLSGLSCSLMAAVDADNVWLENETEEMIGVDKKQDLVVNTLNYETGIVKDQHSVYNDSSALSFLVHGNLKLNKVSELKMFEVNYSANLSNYTWLVLSAAQLTGTFGSIAENKTSGNTGNSSAEINFVRPEESSVSILSLGAGLSYRYKFFPEIFEWENVFETVGAMITYNQLDDSFRGLKYTGPGLRADYGMHKRLSRTFQIGLQGSYNAAIVKREAAFDKEKASDRSLVLTWLTLAFNLGIYF